MLLLVANTTYIIAMVFFIFCFFHEDYEHSEYYKNTSKEEIDKFREEHFLTNFGLEDKTPSELTLIAFYYTFTTLSTVGFGDMYPKSNMERIVVILILIFGISTFSYVMGVFLDIMNEVLDFNKDYDEYENLAKFFATIRKFNANDPIDPTLKSKMITYFKHRWNNDLNSAVQESENWRELPTNTKESIYLNFLFDSFIA